MTVWREGNELKASVEVASRALGHRVPTGSPLRQLRLKVTTEGYDGPRFRQERVYHRVAADADGRPLKLEHQVFLKGARLVSDTRLAPGEKRVENFSFALPAGRPATVKVSLVYYYSPMAREEAEQRLNFLTLQRLVR